MSITLEFAEQLAEVAELLDPDEPDDAVLARVTRAAVDLVPHCTAAAVTIVGDDGDAWTFAVSDDRVRALHDAQFQDGEGPVVEALRHNEPRRVDDARTEARWAQFSSAMASAGFVSCLCLPLRTGRQPAGALCAYATTAGAFGPAAHDVALLLAAQGATAVVNDATYRSCRELVDNLHVALESRAVIEQAKGILHASLGVAVDDAIDLLRRAARNRNEKLRRVAEQLVAGELDPDSLGS